MSEITREAQAELNRRADLLSSLLRSPGWAFMEEEMDRKIERLRKVAGNVALSPNGADQSKLDTIRGTIAALHWMKGVPRHADATLRRFLEEQGIEEEHIGGDDGS